MTAAAVTSTPPQTAAAAHRALVQALLEPARYPHAVKRVELIETHISSVLLTGRFAYKIKKPLDLGFLDFTTLTARRYFCEEELRLNRRLAPRIYLGVVSIGGTAESPQIGATDSVIEYAVKMVEFPQESLLDRMLADAALQPQHIDLLAAAVASFHARTARVSGNDEYGSAARIGAPMRQNFMQLRSVVGPEENAVLDRLARWSEERHAALTAAMEERRRQGYVRECHGDLHLGNIALVDGEVQIFDCIEFDPDLRWIDVMNEMAFLVMDLYARGRPDYAARLLNGWLEISGDYAGMRLLPYYLVYRAMVRAKIARIRAAQASLAASQRQAALAEYAERIELAQAFAAAPRPALIITRGVSGSGKTTVTQPLLQALGALRLRSDVERKRLHRLAREAHTSSAPGAGIYGEATTRATYDELQRLARLTLGAGFSTIVDATFLQRSRREPFRALAAELDIPFLILDCDAEPALLRERVARRRETGVDASEATIAVLERQLRSAEALDGQEAPYAIRIDTQRDDMAQVVVRVRAFLERMRA